MVFEKDRMINVHLHKQAEDVIQVLSRNGIMILLEQLAPLRYFEDYLDQQVAQIALYEMVPGSKSSGVMFCFCVFYEPLKFKPRKHMQHLTYYSIFITHGPISHVFEFCQLLKLVVSQDHAMLYS
tara:strand:+ start:472 stop:846 length:375 start_codon:yes stop_codon:yes gene_type:complete